MHSNRRRHRPKIALTFSRSHANTPEPGGGTPTLWVCAADRVRARGPGVLADLDPPPKNWTPRSKFEYGPPGGPNLLYKVPNNFNFQSW